MMQAQALPHAVAEDEAGIEHGNHGLGARHSSPLIEIRMFSLRGSIAASWVMRRL